MAIESGWAAAAKGAEFHPDPSKQDPVNNNPEIVRNSAIEQASPEQLTAAIDRMEAGLEESPKRGEILAALALAKTRLEQLLKENQN